MMRRHVNKRRAAGKFKKHIRHTKAANLSVMRGGYRL